MNSGIYISVLLFLSIITPGELQLLPAQFCWKYVGVNYSFWSCMILRAVWFLQGWQHIYASLIQSPGWASRCLCTTSAHMIDESKLSTSRKVLGPSFQSDISVISWSRWKTECKQPLTISTLPIALHFFPRTINYWLALDQLQRLSSRWVALKWPAWMLLLSNWSDVTEKFLLRGGWWIITSSGNHTMYFTLPPTSSSNKHWPMEWIP